MPFGNPESIKIPSTSNSCTDSESIKSENFQFTTLKSNTNSNLITDNGGKNKTKKIRLFISIISLFIIGVVVFLVILLPLPPKKNSDGSVDDNTDKNNNFNTISIASINETVKGLYFDKEDNLYLSTNDSFQKLNKNKTFSIIASNYSSSPFILPKREIGIPNRFIIKNEKIYFTDTLNHQINSIIINPNSDQFSILTKIAGSSIGFLDDKLPFSKFNDPFDIALGNDEKIYVSDRGNKKLRILTTQGTSSIELQDPTILTFQEDTNKVYIIDDGNVACFDPKNEAVEFVNLGKLNGTISDIVYSKELYLLDNNGTVYTFTENKLKFIGKFKTKSSQMAVNSKGKIAVFSGGEILLMSIN